MTDPMDRIRRMAQGPTKPPSTDDIVRRMITGPAKVEPSAEHREAALALRGLYVAFTDQGFTPDQSMDLIKTAMTRGQQ